MKNFFRFITELIGWFQILLLPLFLGLIFGAAVYFSRRDTLGLILGVSIAALGLIAGIVFATRIWLKKRHC